MGAARLAVDNADLGSVLSNELRRDASDWARRPKFEIASVMASSLSHWVMKQSEPLLGLVMLSIVTSF
jgi:hypothetical protein